MFMRKTGLYATSRVNTIYYSKNGVSDGNVTYTYDGMGNIVSINENGKQRYKYAYDKIGRLVSKKDIDENREICYTYDDNGNILTKTDNGTVTDYRYKDGPDCLMAFGSESFAYDNMGNPTTYRNMLCVWEKGRHSRVFQIEQIRFRLLTTNLVCVHPKPPAEQRRITFMPLFYALKSKNVEVFSLHPNINFRT